MLNRESGRSLEFAHLGERCGHFEGAHGIHVGGDDGHALVDLLGVQEGHLTVEIDLERRI